jgi:hypothetical protein
VSVRVLLLVMMPLAFSACAHSTSLSSTGRRPAVDDGVVVQTARGFDEALAQLYVALKSQGLAVPQSVPGSRRLQYHAWTVAGDTTLAVGAQILETTSMPNATVIVLTATWSAPSAGIHDRQVTSGETPVVWSAFRRLGESVTAFMRP